MEAEFKHSTAIREILCEHKLIPDSTSSSRGFRSQKNMESAQLQMILCYWNDFDEETRLRATRTIKALESGEPFAVFSR